MRDYGEFLAYLHDNENGCQGCTGKRRFERCLYAIACAIAESLAQKGLVKDSQELRNHGRINRSNDYLPTGYISTDDSNYANIGPCENEP